MSISIHISVRNIDGKRYVKYMLVYKTEIYFLSKEDGDDSARNDFHRI